MWWIVIGLVVVIALLVWWLDRRGSTGMSQNGSTDTVAGAVGQVSHKYGPDRGGYGGF
ncbi:hypothetical protein [Knoellia subterranea]|uniref:Uncharacterized protein n=1 Tax=Knoellia subterranea KCTC 19937 TaxID=1385521 RepID=A0A0A0JNK5_9MICO|nr:hypothetical protein [Knoellia subterranea]KGN38344.1 hypothetical protein N803_11090 [Knoellia subterranea KCTC 19937]